MLAQNRSTGETFTYDDEVYYTGKINRYTIGIKGQVGIILGRGETWHTLRVRWPAKTLHSVGTEFLKKKPEHREW